MILSTSRTRNLKLLDEMAESYVPLVLPGTLRLTTRLKFGLGIGLLTTTKSWSLNRRHRDRVGNREFGALQSVSLVPNGGQRRYRALECRPRIDRCERGQHYDALYAEGLTSTAVWCFKLSVC